MLTVNLTQTFNKLNSKLMQYSERIRKIRETKGFKQDYIADKLGISTTAYSKMENGETKITLDKLEKIAEVYKTDVESILKFDPHINFNVHNSPKSAIGTNPVYHENEKLVEQLKNEVSFLKEQMTKLWEISREKIKVHLNNYNEFLKQSHKSYHKVFCK